MEITKPAQIITQLLNVTSEWKAKCIFCIHPNDAIQDPYIDDSIFQDVEALYNFEIGLEIDALHSPAHAFSLDIIKLGIYPKLSKKKITSTKKKRVVLQSIVDRIYADFHIDLAYDLVKELQKSDKPNIVEEKAETILLDDPEQHLFVEIKFPAILFTNLEFRDKLMDVLSRHFKDM